MENTFNKIKQDLAENDVVLYMKGNAKLPMCGFSGVAVQVLNRLSVPFKAVNILEDEEMRKGIKEYANWPTIPQLYIKGEFIGGCDIIKEMYASGELQKVLSSKGVNCNQDASHV